MVAGSARASAASWSLDHRCRRRDRAIGGPLIDRLGLAQSPWAARWRWPSAMPGWLLPGRRPRVRGRNHRRGGATAPDPSQSTLVATLSPQHLRHRATAVSRVAANIGGRDRRRHRRPGRGYGLPDSSAVPGQRHHLSLVRRCPDRAPCRDCARRRAPPGGYGLVARDELRHLAIVNVAIIAVGWGVFNMAGTALCQNALASARRSSGCCCGHAATVAIAQVPDRRLAEGRRRVRDGGAGRGRCSSAPACS